MEKKPPTSQKGSPSPVRPRRKSKSKKTKAKKRWRDEESKMIRRPSPPPPPLPPREVQQQPQWQQHAPLQKTSSLQSSTTARSQDATPAPLDLSQDSGVVSGASPAQWPTAQLPQHQASGVYDNLHVIEVASTPPSSTTNPEARDATRVSLRSRRASSSPSGSGRWRLGSFFKRKGRKEEEEEEENRRTEEEEHFRQLIVKEAGEQAPPLPPRQQQVPSGFQPTLGVKSFHSSSLPAQQQHLHSPTVPSLSPFSNYDNGLYFYDNSQPPTASSRDSTLSRTWREQKEDMMQRVEAKRNSFRDSSSEDDEFDETSSQNSSVLRSVPFGGQQQPQRRSGRHKRSSWRRSRDLVPDPVRAQMDVLARLSQIDPEEGGVVDGSLLVSPAYTGTSPPPPPPPRDPRRRLYLVKGESGRPVSYSFEQLPHHHSPAGVSPFGLDPDDLGLPLVPRSTQHQVPPSPAYVCPPRRMATSPAMTSFQPIPSPSQEECLLRSHRLSASDHHLSSHLSHRRRPDSTSHVTCRPSTLDENPRSRRAVRLDRSLPPNVQHHASQPSLLVSQSQPRSASNPPAAEYWKPPPPFSAIPLHCYDKVRLAYSDHSRDCSPQRPLRKKSSGGGGASARHFATSNSSRDSVISPQQSAGVSSITSTATSSSSIEKSGKSSPSSISSKDSGCSEPQHQMKQQRPLETLIEKSESADRIVEPSTPPKEHSPVRSFAGDPGFSTKQRRSRFRDALNELEDVLVDIQRDQDLLDRAERRDLPTAHQELIAQARERFQGGPSEETSRQDGDDSGNENAFSDLDAFMNWNTSSSFENIEAAAAASSVSPSSGSRSRRTRTPSNRRSARFDKRTDDVVYRICRSNNRPAPETANPISKVDQSYLLLSPATAASSCSNKARTAEEEDEPDVVADDLGLRRLRDVNSGNISDPQPKFGIPKTPALACSDKDYLHARPASNRYRSTFNAMRNPDIVLDDLAFRNLRKDDSLADPVTLGNRDLGKPDEYVGIPSAIGRGPRRRGKGRVSPRGSPACSTPISTTP